MRAVRLLEHAITKNPETVLDVGTGIGMHTFSFLAQGYRVTGIDVRQPPLEHPLYDHINEPYESADLGDRKFDLVWCCHTLEHVPNVQHCLIHLRHWLKDNGWLAIAVPPANQNRLHVGHLTLWTPAHLIYNMICAGWDCREAIWYTEYQTIGLMVQKKPDIDLTWRTGMPSEVFALNDYSPVYIRHECGSWWANNWHEETIPHTPDPPSVTIGHRITNLPPEVQLGFGPNPNLRKQPGG